MIQIGLWVQPISLGRFQQGEDRRTGVGPSLSVAEEPVLSADGHWADAVLAGIVRKAAPAILEVCFGVFLLLRVALCFALVPKRSNHDNYFLARRSAFNFFILLVTVQLLTVGICYLAGVPENILRMVLLAEAGFIYLVLIIRRGQILSAYCNPLATFLYLCALEILPTVLFVIPAVAL